MGSPRPNELGCGDDHEMGRWLNNPAEKSHLPFRRRERAMLRFRRMRTLLKFAFVHASVHNHFPTERHLRNRDQYKVRHDLPVTPSSRAVSFVMARAYCMRHCAPGHNETIHVDSI